MTFEFAGMSVDGYCEGNLFHPTGVRPPPSWWLQLATLIEWKVIAASAAKTIIEEWTKSAWRAVDELAKKLNGK